MKRPMVFITINLILGIICGRYITNYKYIVLIFIGFFCLLVAKRNLDKALPFLISLSFIAGYGLIIYKTPHIAPYNDNVYFNGVVKEINVTTSGNEEILLDVFEVSYNNKIINENFKAICYLENGMKVKERDLLVLYGKALTPQKPANKGGFDNSTYMLSNGYSYTMYPEKVTKYGEAQNNFFYAIKNIREKVNESLDKIFLNPNVNGVVKAIVTGNTNYLSPEISEIYTGSGAIHILAVSGLHTGIIGGIILFLGKTLGLSRFKNTVLSIGILVLYMFFVGNKISVTRAVIMFSVVVIGTLIFRLSDILSSLSLSAFIILVFNPWQLWDVGFQLSFMCILIISFTITKAEKVKTIIDFLFEIIKISLCISIGTLPILAWYFYEVSMVGFITNIFIIPFLGIVVIFGILSGFIGLINTSAGVFVGGCVHVIITWFNFICGKLYNLPISKILIGRPSTLFVIAFYLLLIGLYIVFIKLKKNGYLLIFVSVSSLLFVLYNSKPKYNQIDFLYVGQGDCVVIQTSFNQTFLIDTGISIESNNPNSQYNINSASSVIIPYLKYYGIDKIDGVFITHLDIDHAGGCEELIKEINVSKLYFANTINTSEEIFEEIKYSANTKNIPIEFIDNNFKLDIAKNIELECIHPNFSHKNTYFNSNNNSLVLKLYVGEKSFIFTGDIEADVEKELIAKNVNLEADVLKVSHHGSITSSSLDFLERVNMNYAVISAGKNNVYKHPHEDVIKNLNIVNAQTYNTAISGTISFKTDGNFLKVEEEVLNDKP